MVSFDPKEVLKSTFSSHKQLVDLSYLLLIC
jgi:hypothetical protein